jgi:hypothetical protein
VNDRSPTAKTKSSRRSKTGPARELRGFLIRIALSNKSASFTQTGSRSGLSALGKLAAQAWVDLGSQEGIRVDAVLFRAQELEGLVFLRAGNPDRGLGLAIRLLKTRIARAAEKIGLPSGWRKAYQSKSLPGVRDVAAARRRIVREAGALRKKSAS